jgi:hypothetical protein
LLQERDARVLTWQREYPEVENIHEDRRLEVTSQMAISVEAWWARWKKALARG